MRQEYVIKEFTVICDVTGKVEQVTSYHSWNVLRLIGYNFSKLLDKDSQTVFKHFLSVVKKQGYAFGFVLSIKINNTVQPVCVNAFYKNHKYHISVLIGCLGTLKTLQEIQRINVDNQISYIKPEKPQKEENVYATALENWVMKDPLTNLFNQRYFNSAIYKEAAKARVTGRTITIIAIDFDNLKEYNDEFGYRKGDEFLLTFVSVTLRLLNKEKDILFRLEGDEFLILSTDQNQTEAYQLMGKITDDLRKYTSYTSFSYGIVEILPEYMGEDFDIIPYLKEADKKISQDKKSKKIYDRQYKI